MRTVQDWRCWFPQLPESQVANLRFSLRRVVDWEPASSGRNNCSEGAAEVRPSQRLLHVHMSSLVTEIWFTLFRWTRREVIVYAVVFDLYVAIVSSPVIEQLISTAQLLRNVPRASPFHARKYLASFWATRASRYLLSVETSLVISEQVIEGAICKNCYRPVRDRCQRIAQKSLRSGGDCPNRRINTLQRFTSV